jgi:hypothetical protein
MRMQVRKNDERTRSERINQSSLLPPLGILPVLLLLSLLRLHLVGGGGNALLDLVLLPLGRLREVLEGGGGLDTHDGGVTCECREGRGLRKVGRRVE